MTDPGKVYLYQFNRTTFVLEQTISRGDALSRFGQALSLKNAQLLVGAPGTVPGSAYLFDADTAAETSLFLSETAEADDDFGSAVTLAGNLAIIGSPASNSVYVYENSGTVWTLLATLVHSDENAKFGSAPAADNGIILIGAYGIDKAYVYDIGDIETGIPTPVRNDNWPAAMELTGQADSRFGFAVTMSGSTIWISSPRETIEGKRHGVVRQYESLEPGGWTQSDTITAAVPGSFDDKFRARYFSGYYRFTGQ